MKRCISAGVLMFGYAIFAGACFGQKAVVPDPRSLAREFEDVLRGNNQPGGSVVVIDGCTKDSPEIPIHLPQAPTRLMQIAKANPDYTVTNAEVPNFVPKNNEPDLLRSFVRLYMLDSNSSPGKVLDGLLNLDELQPAIEASGLRRGLEIISGPQPPPWKPEEPRRTRTLRSLTLREALNEIAAFYGTGRWTYRQFKECNGAAYITRIYFTIY